MNVETYYGTLIGTINGVKERMSRLGMSPKDVADAGNLHETTVSRFVNGKTFSPHNRTVMSCDLALNGKLEHWENILFVEKKVKKVRTVQSLRKALKKSGFKGILIDKKDQGVVLQVGREAILVRAQPNELPISEWVEFAADFQRKKHIYNIPISA